MRVAVVAEWYPGPADPVHGIWAHRQAVATAALGAEIQVLALRRPVPPLSAARRLAHRPLDPAPLREWAGGMRAQLAPHVRDGIPVHAVPWLGPPRPLSYGTWGWWMAPSLGVALDRLHAAWPFDLVHAHCLAPAGHAAARWVARRPAGDRPGFVVSGHGGDLYHVADGSPAGARAIRTALHAADLALANSSWAAGRIASLTDRPVAIDVVHLGADLGPAPPPPGGRDRLRLITVAHLQRRKHHHVVLDALARLPSATRPRYEIVGDGEERDPLRHQVQALGLTGDVTFTGQLANPEAVARIAAADLFVMPGVEEPFGVAFVEAMGVGVPAVGSRGEGGPEDIAAAGEGMLLVDADDPAELAALIARLDGDRSELRRLGAAARATVAAEFTWERCGARTLAAYERVRAAR